jgi:hypothetical protein
MKFLKSSLRLGQHELTERCLTAVAKNFCHSHSSSHLELFPNRSEADYSSLPPNVFLQLLSHKSLAVKVLFTLFETLTFSLQDEWMLYTAIRKYVQSNSIDHETTQTMMASVRFRWMDFKKLEQVVADNLVDNSLLVPALMERVRLLENPSALPNYEDVRLQRRLANGIEFQYVSDFDEHGILHWIASNGNQEEWKNPHNQQLIRVSSSSLERGNWADLCERDPHELWTKDVPASWFQIDLKHRLVVPTHFTLRHGMATKADFLRTWDFQGSRDGSNWELITRHKQDESLDEGFASHSWRIGPMRSSFRIFRILQTAKNSSNHNFLVLSGFELYGELYEIEPNSK